MVLRPAAQVAELAEECAVRRFMYVSGGGVAGLSLASFLAQLPAALAAVLLVLVVAVAGVLSELQRRRDHELGMHAVDQRADPALIEALRRRRSP